MDPLFPEIPEKLTELSDEDLANLLQEHEVAAKLIKEEDEDFLKGATADEVLEALELGATQVETIRAEQSARLEAEEKYAEEKASKLSRFEAEEVVAEEPEEAAEEEEEKEAEAEAVVAEAEAITEEAVEEVAEERELVTASVETEEVPEEVKKQTPRPVRRPPMPSADRQLQDSRGAALVAAAGLQEVRAGQMLDRDSLAEAMKREAVRRGRPSKNERGIEERILIARADFQFPEERVFTGNIDEDTRKIRSVVPEYTGWGDFSGQALTASGGLCAPLEPIYSMPNFGSTAEPVWDSLPVFNASRGGVNVPAATAIGDITEAISSISEEEDSLGGTFATKSCQDLDCPEYTEVAVQILAHCREYGNLNARAWPEKIAHENELTMQALARTTESFMLGRIKALSVNVTQAEILGAYGDLVHALTKAAAHIRFVLRMPAGARFNVVIPAWIADLLAADTAYTQFDRFQAQAAMIGHLESLGFRVVLYGDDVAGGTSQGFTDQAAAALADFPDDVQYAIYPEGQFIGIDSGVLELGIVRDSTLNSRNDFQIFGERFRNLAMLGPAQGAYWVTQGVCPSGEFPDLDTGLTC